jgi:hypothetical protein
VPVATARTHPAPAAAADPLERINGICRQIGSEEECRCYTGSVAAAVNPSAYQFAAEHLRIRVQEVLGRQRLSDAVDKDMKAHPGDEFRRGYAGMAAEGLVGMNSDREESILRSKMGSDEAWQFVVYQANKAQDKCGVGRSGRGAADAADRERARAALDAVRPVGSQSARYSAPVARVAMQDGPPLPVSAPDGQVIAYARSLSDLSTPGFLDNGRRNVILAADGRIGVMREEDFQALCQREARPLDHPGCRGS